MIARPENPLSAPLLSCCGRGNSINPEVAGFNRPTNQPHANQISWLIFAEGKSAEVVEHSDGESMRSKRVIVVEVGPELILIVTPRPEPPIYPDIDPASRRIKCP